MSQKNDGKISIANIIAMIGLAGLGVISFFGALLKSADGTPGGAIITAIAIVVGLTFLLFLSIKAKGAEDNPDKWRYVEYAALIAYIVAAIFVAKPFLRFFYVVSEKTAMQAQAQSEVDAIKSLYASYDQQSSQALGIALEQFRNYASSQQGRDASDNGLAEYVEKVMPLDSGWISKAVTITSVSNDPQLLEIEEKIETWNYMQLASLAAELEEKDGSTWTRLNDKINENREKFNLIPIVSGGGSTPYRLDGYVEYELGEAPQPLFAQMLRGADGSTPLGWILYVVLHLLVLLNYFVASRSSFVGPRQNTKQPTGGLDL